MSECKVHGVDLPYRWSTCEECASDEVDDMIDSAHDSGFTAGELAERARSVAFIKKARQRLGDSHEGIALELIYEAIERGDHVSGEDV